MRKITRTGTRRTGQAPSDAGSSGFTYPPDRLELSVPIMLIRIAEASPG